LNVYSEKTKGGFRQLDKLRLVLIISIYHPALVKETYMKNAASSQATPTGKTD